MAEQAPPSLNPHPAHARYAGVRVLLFGGTGFIGPWLADALTRAGADVTVAARDRRRAAAAGVFPVRPRIAVTALADAASVRALFASFRPAITFNLAAYCAHPGQYDEAASAQANVTLAWQVADAAAAYRDPDWPGVTLLHTGTAEEYGPIPGDLREDTPPRPATMYGRMKLRGTEAVLDVALTSRMPSLIARLFVVYGAGERPARLVPSLIAASRTGAHVDLSSGVQQRDFTYVEDVADGLLRLGLSAAAPGTIVNLATGRARPVRAFVEEAAQALGLRSEQLRFGARAPHASDVSHDDVSIERLRTLTDWTPSTMPTEGVRRAAAWLHNSAMNAADE